MEIQCKADKNCSHFSVMLYVSILLDAISASVQNIKFILLKTTFK